MTDFEKLTPTQKWISGIIFAGGIILGRYYLFKKHKPRFEISKYNKTPNIKKPRKWRRILRRKKQKNDRKSKTLQ